MPPVEVQCSSEQELKNYFMTFRSGMQPFGFKGFSVRGDLSVARKRAMEHAKIMNYKNIWVFPQVSDLATEEKQRLGPSEVSVKAQENLPKAE